MTKMNVSLTNSGVNRPLMGIPVDIEVLRRRNVDLGSAYQELAHAYAALQHEADQSKARAGAAAHELQAFLHSVCHDLRAPLRAIEGFSQMLAEECASGMDESSQRSLQRLRDASQQMDRMLQQLVRLSRVSDSPLRLSTINLSQLAEEGLAAARQADPARAIESRIAPQLMAQADQRLMQTAVHELIANAVKFTAKSSPARIEFGVAEQQGQAVYFVRDNGIGFPAAYADRLFAIFQRLHPADEYPGMGAGLAIVQKIIRRHGGTAWAEGALDKGATFFFTLHAVPGPNEGGAKRL